MKRLLIQALLSNRHKAKQRPTLPDFLGGAMHGLIEDTMRHIVDEMTARPLGANHAKPPVGWYSLQPPAYAQLHLQTQGRTPLTFEWLVHESSPYDLASCLYGLVANERLHVCGFPLEIARIVLLHSSGLHLDLYDSEEGLTQENALWSHVSEAWLPQTSETQALPFTLRMTSPLLLASKGVQAAQRASGRSLPWPSLASLLRSVAQRCCLHEPSLAATLGIANDWQPQDHLAQVFPQTNPLDPAFMVNVSYHSVSERSGESIDQRYLVPGLLGDLRYEAVLTATEQALLMLGQILGAGQKRTMGFGGYELLTEPFEKRKCDDESD